MGLPIPICAFQVLAHYLFRIIPSLVPRNTFAVQPVFIMITGVRDHLKAKHPPRILDIFTWTITFAAPPKNFKFAVAIATMIIGSPEQNIQELAVIGYFIVSSSRYLLKLLLAEFVFFIEFHHDRPFFFRLTRAIPYRTYNAR